MKKYELKPLPTQQKSFYGKAYVTIDKYGRETLYSYDTKIIRRSKTGSLERLYPSYTQTTGKHIKAFCGLSKKEFMALPYKLTTYDKAKLYQGEM